MLGICLAILSGCASISAQVVRDENVILAQASAEHPATDPVELAILSAIASMSSGEKGAAGTAAYVVGDAYSAASGVLCKSVTITQNANKGTRLACTNGQRWSFSSDVFLVGSKRD